MLEEDPELFLDFDEDFEELVFAGALNVFTTVFPAFFLNLGETMSKMTMMRTTTPIPIQT